MGRRRGKQNIQQLRMEQQEPNYFERTEKLVRQYIDDRVLLLKLTATEKVARLASAMVIFMVISLFGFLLLLFVSILAGYLLSLWTKSYPIGFGIVTLFYLIVLILVLTLRKKYLDPLITNTVVRIFFDKTTDNDGDDNPATETKA